MLQVRSVRMDMAQDGTAGRVHGVVFQGMLKFPFEERRLFVPAKLSRPHPQAWESQCTI